MSVSAPIVTVLMPVYNNAAYLREAIDSILGQTLRNLEFLIIDDGSSDESPQIVESYADARIRLIRHESNLGLIESLNQGLDLARGKYVARMDGDDISSAARLATQVSFMESNPSVGVCGTWAVMSGKAAQRPLRHPLTHDEIRAKLLFECALAHPSVILDRKQFEHAGLRYDQRFPRVEDYALWVRCAESTRLANIGRTLLTYRMHETSVGSLHKDEQNAVASVVRAGQLENLGIQVSPAEQKIHDSLSQREYGLDRAYVEASEEWLMKLQRANRRHGRYAEPAFSRALADRWFGLCAAGVSRGLLTLRECFASPLARQDRFPSRQRFKVLWQRLRKAPH